MNKYLVRNDIIIHYLYQNVKLVLWQEPDRIEQYMIIKRALIEIYNVQTVQEALVFRGGQL